MYLVMKHVCRVGWRPQEKNKVENMPWIFFKKVRKCCIIPIWDWNLCLSSDFFSINFLVFSCCFHVQCLYRCYGNISSCLMKPFSEFLVKFLWDIFVFLGSGLCSWQFLWLYSDIKFGFFCFFIFGSLFLHSSLTTLNSFHRKCRIIQILLHILHILSWTGCFSKIF